MIFFYVNIYDCVFMELPFSFNLAFFFFFGSVHFTVTVSNSGLDVGKLWVW